MGKGRLEAFSDGVIAVIITIMVLEMKVPHGTAFESLAPLWPVFLAYVMSFIYVGIYWNNHHHLMHAAHRVNGSVLWANLHLLFWLSLVPFVTGWMFATNTFGTCANALTLQASRTSASFILSPPQAASRSAYRARATWQRPSHRRQAPPK